MITKFTCPLSFDSYWCKFRWSLAKIIVENISSHYWLSNTTLLQIKSFWTPQSFTSIYYHVLHRIYYQSQANSKDIPKLETKYNWLRLQYLLRSNILTHLFQAEFLNFYPHFVWISKITSVSEGNFHLQIAQTSFFHTSSFYMNELFFSIPSFVHRYGMSIINDLNPQILQ